MPVLVIDPRQRDWPEELSDGTRPTNEPIELPVNLLQSPISTANPNPVSVEMPRRQPSLRTTSVYRLLAAKAAIR